MTADDRMGLPAGRDKRRGSAQGGEATVGRGGDADRLRVLDRVVGRAQAMSRALVAGKRGTGVDDFLAERAREAETE